MVSDRPYRNEEWLRQKYVDENMSQTEMADLCDTGPSTISSWMKRHGVETDMSRTKRREVPRLRVDSDGYEVVKSCGDEVLIHRLSAVAWFGFGSVSGKDVHHENGIGWDNREDNFDLLTRGEHIALHHREGHMPQSRHVFE